MLMVTQLNGFGVQDASASSSFTLVAYATRPGTVSGEYTATIDVPAGAMAGDLGVLVDRVIDGGSTPSTVIPSGWTQAAGATQTTGTRKGNIRVSYKILGSGDLGATLSTMSGGGSMRKALLVFRWAAGAVSSVTAGSWAASMTDAAPSSQVISSGSGTPPMIVLVSAGVYAGLAPVNVSTTAAMDGFVISDATAAELWVGYKFLSAAPSNLTASLPDVNDANSLASGYLAIS